MDFNRLVLAYMVAFQGGHTEQLIADHSSMLTKRQIELAYKQAWKRHNAGEWIDEVSLY